eukprot:3076807-Pyramimonas_sp.AAC.1
MVKDGSAWVNHQSELWQCSLEQVRLASSDACRGAELPSTHYDDIRQQLSRRGRRHGFKNLTTEGPYPEWAWDGDRTCHVPDDGGQEVREDQAYEKPGSTEEEPR